MTMRSAAGVVAQWQLTLSFGGEEDNAQRLRRKVAGERMGAAWTIIGIPVRQLGNVRMVSYLKGAEKEWAKENRAPLLFFSTRGGDNDMSW